jgi:pentatricopeptide repeat protein
MMYQMHGRMMPKSKNNLVREEDEQPEPLVVVASAESRSAEATVLSQLRDAIMRNCSPAVLWELYNSMISKHLMNKSDYGGLIQIMSKDTHKASIDRCFSILDEMLHHGLTPSISLFHLILQSKSIKAKDITNVLSLLEKHQIQPTSLTFDLFINAYQRIKDTRKAVWLFEHMAPKQIWPSPPVFVSLIETLVQNKRIAAAENVLRLSLSANQTPLAAAYSAIIKYLINHRELSKATEYIKVLLSRGIRPDVSIVKLLETCLKESSVEPLQQHLTSHKQAALSKIQTSDDLVSTTKANQRSTINEEGATISQCAIPQLPLELQMLLYTVISPKTKIRPPSPNFEDLLLERPFDKLLPSRQEVKNLMHENAKIGKASNVEDVLLSMQMANLSVPTSAVKTLMHAYGKAGNAEQVAHISEHLMERECNPSMAQTCLVRAYAKSGDVDKALRLMGQLEEDNQVPTSEMYHDVANALASFGEIERCQQLLHRMVQHGMPMTTAAYTILAKGFSMANDLSNFSKIPEYVSNSHLKADTVFFNTVINACCKHKQYTEAWRMFDLMHQSGVQADIATYTCLLRLAATESNSRSFNQILADLRNANIEPDEKLGAQILLGLIDLGASEKSVDFIKPMFEDGSASKQIVAATMQRLLHNKQVQHAADLWQVLENKNYPIDSRIGEAYLYGLVRQNAITEAHRALSVLRQKDVSVSSRLIDLLDIQ